MRKKATAGLLFREKIKNKLFKYIKYSYLRKNKLRVFRKKFI